MRRIAAFGPNEIFTGIHPSLPPNVAPLWVDGRNVLFQELGVRPDVGQSFFIPKLQKAPVIGMLEMRQDEKRVLYYGTRSKLFKYVEGGTVEEVGTGYTGVDAETPDAPATRWSLQAWGDWVLATNGVNDILVDKNDTNDFVPLSGTPVANFRPEILIKSGSYMLAFTHQDGQAGHVSYWWCSDNDVEDWVVDASNTAGSNSIHDAQGAIKAAMPLGSYIAALTDNTMHLISFIGDPYYWGTAAALEGIGACSKDACQTVGRVMYGFGPKGIWRTDGADKVYISTPSVFDYIFDDINMNQLSQVVSWHDIQRDRIVWWWCSKNSMVLNRAIAFQYNGDLWHIPGFIRSAATEQGVFQFPLLGDTDGNVLAVGIPGSLPMEPGAPLALRAKVQIVTSAGYGQGKYGRTLYGGQGFVDG